MEAEEGSLDGKQGMALEARVGDAREYSWLEDRHDGVWCRWEIEVQLTPKVA